VSAYTWVRGFSPFHHGIDLAASTGTPIHAIIGGTVTYAGDARVDPTAPSLTAGGGITAEINIGGGRQMLYGHMQRVAVATGQSVAAGQVIGTVDTTGDATGPHVHIGLWQAGTGFLDPLSLMSLGAIIAAVSGGSIVVTAGAGSTPAPAGSTCAGSIGPCFPTGHALTDADIHTILDRWIAVFPAYRDPLSGGVAQAATLDILRTFVGQPWTDATIKRLADALNAGTAGGGQYAALGVVGESIGAAAAALGAIPAAIIGAVAGVVVNLGILIVILVLAYRGLQGLLEPVGGGPA
jgi:Peptidase family M23